MQDSSATDGEAATHDHLAIHCPRLGGQVTFAYCRRESGGLPCQRTILCWQGRFPVAVFLDSVLTEEQRAHWAKQRPTEKVVTLLELLEAAKERLQDEEGAAERVISRRPGTE